MKINYLLLILLATPSLSHAFFDNCFQNVPVRQAVGLLTVWGAYRLFTNPKPSGKQANKQKNRKRDSMLFIVPMAAVGGYLLLPDEYRSYIDGPVQKILKPLTDRIASRLPSWKAKGADELQQLTRTVEKGASQALTAVAAAAAASPASAAHLTVPGGHGASEHSTN